MKLFRKKSKTLNDFGRNRNKEPRQKVISYYTASKKQLDNFDRQSQYGNKPSIIKHAKNLPSKWFHIIAVTAVMACIFYVGSLGNKPRVVVEGSQYRTAAEYHAVVAAVYGNDFRNKVKPLLMTKNIERAVAKVVPEASVVNVSSSLLGHQPDIQIINDEPLVIFTQPNAPDLLMGKRGRLLLPTTKNTKQDVSNLPILQNITGIEGKAGEQFMRPDETDALRRLIGQYAAENTNKPIFSLTTTPHELTATEVGRGTYYVRYLLDNSIITQYGALRATEKKLSEISQQAAEYIDVRLGDKAYYK